MKQKTNILANLSNGFYFFVMWRYFNIVLQGKRELLNRIKEKRAKEYLLWSIKCAKTANGLVKKDSPFCSCTSAELGLELGMSVNDALDFHNDLNHIVNAT